MSAPAGGNTGRHAICVGLDAATGEPVMFELVALNHMRGRLDPLIFGGVGYGKRHAPGPRSGDNGDAR